MDEISNLLKSSVLVNVGEKEFARQQNLGHQCPGMARLFTFLNMHHNYDTGIAM